jgi:formylglycine-generating enzyme required for sulfatase activity
VSLPSELPSAFISWFQAQEACANAGKRLPTSAEWQVGANGTPDPGPDNGTTDCNTASDQSATLTGARISCTSARGAFDMVGNLQELVADWLPATTTCPGWASFSNDQMCLAGASTTRNFPGAVVRGGWFVSGPGAGPLAVTEFPPFRTTGFVGFRCAR